MAGSASVQWHKGEGGAPTGRRVLLIVKAEGEPFDIQLEGQSEIVVGRRRGDDGFFHVVVPGQAQPKGPLKVEYWAELPVLAAGVKLLK